MRAAGRVLLSEGSSRLLYILTELRRVKGGPAVSQKTTISVIKADVGSYVGHRSVHPSLMKLADDRLAEAKSNGLVIDYRVARCGDDLDLVITHKRGSGSSEIHELAWNIFSSCAEVAREMRLYGAGQDLLSDAFSGNVRGMGPGCAEMELQERASEPVVVFMADKTSPGAWNLPLFRVFADPFCTAGLVIDPALHGGFSFRILDVLEGRQISLSCPAEMYDVLVLIGAPGRYIVKEIRRNADDRIAAVASVEKLNLMAGRYVGKDDPVLIVRCQSGFPAVGEVLEPFSFPHLVAGWMRGSHHGPLMPVAFDDANPSRFDGPPRVVAAGFQVADGALIGPQDMFDDPSFDASRTKAQEIADYMRRHGPFEPHRLPPDEMEYTTLPAVLEKLAGRFGPVEEGL